MKQMWLSKKINTWKSKWKPSSHIFMIGDRVNYPYHGTGEIVSIETYMDRNFYTIQMDKVAMKILVPIDKMMSVGAVYLKDGEEN